jgi:protein-tyrosine phosphatase-like protein
MGAVRTGGVVTALETELERITDDLAGRFPDVARAELARAIRETYEQLARTATVKAHLLNVTRSVVMSELRARRARFVRPNRTAQGRDERIHP